MALPNDLNGSKKESQSKNDGNAPCSSENPVSSPSKTAMEQDDRDFEVSAEALIDEIDDERTLEEEEALAGNNSTAVESELNELKKESEMPIEELLAHYQRMREANGQLEDEGESEDEEEEEEMEDEEDENDDDENLDDTEVRSQDNIKNPNVRLANHNTSQSAQTNQSYQQHQSQTQNQHQQNDPSLSIPPLHENSDRISVRDVQLSSNNDSLDKTHQIPPGTSQQTSEQPPSHASPPPVQTQLSTYVPNVEPVSTRPKHSMTEYLLHTGTSAEGMFKSILDYDLDDSDDMDEDYSCTDDEYGDDERDWRRSIHVGPDHQAEVPEGLAHYEGDLPPYEPNDQLVWRCNLSTNEQCIVDYLKKASALSKRNDVSVSPASVPKISDDSVRLYRERMLELSGSIRTYSSEPNHENVEHPPSSMQDLYICQSRKRARIDFELERENAMAGSNQANESGQHNRPMQFNKDETSNSTTHDCRNEIPTEEYFQDEEQLLFLLLKCNHNFEEALRRRKLDPFKYYLHEPMSLWSQDECLSFEHGLRAYGKDFRSIRENKVPTRSHAELVAFYYLWKKSERHDVYTNQYKLDRKRCLTHPGTTDYMDKFIEDNESTLNASSTPTPTPTESTVDINQVTEVHDPSNSLLTLCNSSEPRPSTLRCLSIPQGAPLSVNHHVHQLGVDGQDLKTNSVHLDGNTTS